jgi:2,3-dihydroxybenzoate-AMP ligase
VSASPPRLAGVTGWPDELAARYRSAGYWTGVSFGALFDDWARGYAGRTAVVDGERRLDFTELVERSRRLAAHLHGLGLRRDDRVVVQLTNSLAFCDLTLALLRLGALPVMALPSHREHEIGHLAAHAEAVALAIPERQGSFDHLAMAQDLRAESSTLRLLLVDGATRGLPDAHALADLVVPGARDDDGSWAAAAGAGDPEGGDVALFLLSGGTTGLPKLIPRTHDDYAYNARASAEVCGVTGEDVYLAVLPVAHNFPLACPGLLGTWQAGGTVVLTRDASPEACFALIARERVSITALVPALALRWLESGAHARHDLSSLRVLQVGGARLEPEAARRVGPVLGARLQQVFGMAEGLLNFTRLDDPDEVVIQTQGRPMCPHDEIRIVDADGRPVAPGEPGELLTRGPYTLHGYFRADEHNARSFTADGFYRTGDVVIADAGGNLIVSGREKDLINRGGEKISATEVENLALAHPAIFNAAAVAMPDRELGERTCLYAVLRVGATLTHEELCTFLSSHRIARFKLPERLELLAELPLTKVGKIDKVALRADIRARLVAEGRDVVWAP